MNRFVLITVCGLLVLCHPVTTRASEENLVCTDVGGLMYGEKTECKKGDLILVNPLMAAFVCDMSLSTISGEKTVVCHYLGKKRSERKAKK